MDYQTVTVAIASRVLQNLDMNNKGDRSPAIDTSKVGMVSSFSSKENSKSLANENS